MQFCRKCLLYLRQERYRIMNLKAELQMLGKIKKAKRGSLFFTDDFLRFGNFSEDIDLAIDRTF